MEFIDVEFWVKEPRSFNIWNVLNKPKRPVYIKMR